MRILLIMLLATIVACNNIQKNNTSSIDTSVLNADSGITDASPVTADFTKDSVITIQFPRNSNSITVTGQLRGINNPVVVHIPVTTGSKLTALLVPEDSLANIRINQVFMPDGKADGPFGRGLTRAITQQGNCKLIIGENLMQGEEWKGKFTLFVKVE